MIKREVFPRKGLRKAQALSIFLCVELLLAPAGAILAAFAPPAFAASESQDAVTEIITARFVFNGTDGSFYNDTVGGPNGAVLGNASGSLEFGRGWWGEGAGYDRIRIAYPGNLSLVSSASQNEVFYSRAAAGPRDRDANGTTVWTAALGESYHAVAFDQDGDGWLDDAVVAFTGQANRYIAYNQAGTQIGQRNLAPGSTWLNDAAALDADSNGVLDQLVFAHQGGLVYVERAPGTNAWFATVAGNAPVLFVAAIDLNADGTLEGVLAAADDVSVQDDEAVYAYNSTGSPLWNYSTGGAEVINLTGVEAAGSHRLNGALVAANNSITVLGAGGQVVWNWSTNATVTAAAAVDFNRDGVVEGAVYADDAGGISYLDGNGSLLAWGTGLAAPIGSLDAIDLDGDGWLNEVVAANDTTVVGLDREGAWLWNATVGAGFRVNMVANADFDGNGTYGDSIVATSSSLYVYNRTGGLRWSAAEARNLRSAAFIENPSAAAAGSYTSGELDAATAASWTNFTFDSAVNSTNETLSASLRFGDGSPGSVTWGPWTSNITGPFLDLAGNSSRFAQVRFDFASADGRNSAHVARFRLNFTTPAATGAVETPAVGGLPPSQWLDLDAQFNLSGGAVRLFYSGDGGASWRAFTPGSSVDALNASAPTLRFRIEMDVGASSPEVAWVQVRYAQPGLKPTLVTPAANTTVGGVVNVTAIADASVSAVDFAYKEPVNGSVVAIGPGAFDSGTGRWWVLWNTSGLNDTGFEVRATAIDLRGFRFEAAVSPVEVDNAPPVVSIRVPSVGGVLTGAARLEATASPDTVSVLFSYLGSLGIVQIGFANETLPGIWNTSWDTSALGEEGIRLYATAEDEAGLSGSDEIAPLTVDNVDPWVRIDGLPPGTQVQGVTLVNLTAAPDVVRIDMSQNGSEGRADFFSGNATESRWTFNWSTLPDIVNGSATLTTVATDRAGHTAMDTVTNLSIDNTAPQPVLVAPTLPGIFTGVVRVAASAPPSAVRMEFYYQEQGGAPHLIRALTDAEKNATTGLWEFNWDTRASALNFNGSLIIEAIPEVGLTGTLNASWILIDNRAPFVRLTAPGPGTSRISGNYSVEAFADADVGSMVLSYMNQTSGEATVLGAMSRASETLWRYAWAIGDLFVPYATLRVYAVDRVGLSSWDNLTNLIIGFNALDSAPVIVVSPANAILDEDFGAYEINLTGHIADDDLPNVTVFVDGIDPGLVTLRNNGSKGALASLWLNSIQDAHSGTSQTMLQLRVVDASGQTATAPFGLLVRSRNDPPAWVSPHDSIYVQAGAVYEMDFSIYVHDVEFEKEDAPLFIGTDDEAHIVQTQNQTTRLSLAFDYGTEFAGMEVFVNFSLTDDDDTLLPRVHQARVIVTLDAIPRITKPVPPIELFEDTPKFNILDLHDYFEDADAEPLFYYSGLGEGFGIRIEAGLLSVDRLPPDWFGQTSMFLGANDELGAFVETRVVLSVAPVNDAPAWDFTNGLNITSFSVHYGLPFRFDLGPYVRDVDTARRNLTIVTSQGAYAHALQPNGSEEAPDAGLALVLDFDETFNGQNVALSIFVTDGEANSSAIGVVVHVTDNYPPEVSKPLPREIVMKEGQTLDPALVLSEFFQDPDGVLYYAFGLVNITVAIDNATGALTLSSPGEWSGTETLVLRAIDNRSAFMDASIIVTVIPVNDPPRIAGIADYRIDAGVLGTIFIKSYVTDPDSDESLITFTVSSAYPGAFVSYSNGYVSFVYPRPPDDTTVLPSFDSLRVCAFDAEGARGCRIIAVRIVQPTTTGFNWLQFFVFVAGVGASAIVLARHFVEFKIKRPPTVEDVFLVYEDGILIKHISKNVRKYADEDVVTSMLSAIQSFAADSFEDKGHWELREVQFQGRKILIEKARKFQIILIFDGDANEDLKSAVKEAAVEVEEKFGEHLKDWDGDPSHFDTVNRIFARVLAVESAHIPEEVTADELVKAPLVPGAVYVSESGGFAPLIKAYLDDIEGLAVVRLRPAADPGVSIEPLKPDEIELIEVAAPKGDPDEEGDDGRTGLDIALAALKEALGESKVAVRGRAPLVLFEGFPFIVDRYGFVGSKKFSDQLKKLASAEGFYLFIAVDVGALTPQQLEGIERGAVVFRGA